MDNQNDIILFDKINPNQDITTKSKQMLNFKHYVIVNGVRIMIIEKDFLINKLNEKHWFKFRLVKDLRTSVKVLDQSMIYHDIDYAYNRLGQDIKNEQSEIKAWLQENPNLNACDIASHFNKKTRAIRRIIKKVYPEYSFKKDNWFENIDTPQLIQFLETNKPLMKIDILKYVENQRGRKVDQMQLERWLIKLNIDIDKYIIVGKNISYEHIVSQLAQLPKTTPINDIPKQLNMSYSTIYKRLAENKTSLTELGYGRKVRAGRKPTKNSFIQWIASQPDNITILEISVHFSVAPPTISTWLRSWNINLHSLNKGPMRNNPNIFYYKNYTLDIRPNIKVKQPHIITIDKLKYKSCIVMVRDGLDSQIHIIDQNETESMQTPKQIITDYIKHLRKDDEF